jgi:hypothetical protein
MQLFFKSLLVGLTPRCAVLCSACGSARLISTPTMCFTSPACIAVPKLNMVAVHKKSMEDACRMRGVSACHEGPTSAGVCTYSSSDDCA